MRLGGVLARNARILTDNAIRARFPEPRIIPTDRLLEICSLLCLDAASLSLIGACGKIKQQLVPRLSPFRAPEEMGSFPCSLSTLQR